MISALEALIDPLTLGYLGSPIALSTVTIHGTGTETNSKPLSETRSTTRRCGLTSRIFCTNVVWGRPLMFRQYQVQPGQYRRSIAILPQKMISVADFFNRFGKV
jgi:hypothetical protein